MKLMTPEIEQALLSAPRDQDPNTTPVIVKFFTPWAGATWWVTEAEKLEDDDYRLFGFADLGDPQCAELGYVLLSDLQMLSGPGGLRIERDLYLPPTMLADVLREYGRL